jgi:hypothetical protein
LWRENFLAQGFRAIDQERSNKMHEFHVHSNTQELMDYTAVPTDVIVEGHLWTGQSTASTAICPKCGRIGLASRGKSRKVIVHSGRIEGNTLVGIDYCTLGNNAKDRN